MDDYARKLSDDARLRKVLIDLDEEVRAFRCEMELVRDELAALRCDVAELKAMLAEDDDEEPDAFLAAMTGEELSAFRDAGEDEDDEPEAFLTGEQVARLRCFLYGESEPLPPLTHERLAELRACMAEIARRRAVSVEIDQTLTKWAISSAAKANPCPECGRGQGEEHDTNCPQMAGRWMFTGPLIPLSEKMQVVRSAADSTDTCELCNEPAEPGRGKNGLDHLCRKCADGLL